MYNSKVSIYARVTINGKQIKISTQRQVSILEWDASAQIVKTKTGKVKEINHHLVLINAKLPGCQSRLKNQGVIITPEILRNEYFGFIEKPRMQVEIIEQHNNDFEKLIGIDYCRVTWTKYNTRLKHVKNFLKWKFNLNDIDIKKLNFEFINDFDFYLKTEKKIDSSTNPRYIKNLRKIVRQCVIKDWLNKDPFIAYKLKEKTQIEHI